MNPHFEELKKRLAEIYDLSKAQQVLSWDQRTMMPPAGAAPRADQLAALARVIYDKATAEELGRLLEDLRPYEDSLPYDFDEASLIRVSRRDYEKLKHIPADLRVAMTRAGSVASAAWIEARQKSDFSLFYPHLEKNLELKFRYIECFDPAPTPYDVLLDDFEPGMTTAEVETTFNDLKKDLVPLIARVNRQGQPVSDECLHGHFPVDRQRAFILSIIERFGFDPQAWRLDATVHPFASGSAPTDIRITTRYYEHFLSAALFGSMHECGHGLYENGVSPSLYHTPLARGASLALHELQSRMWENLVGRSRPFWRYFYPRLQAAFPEQFQNVEMETFYRAINRVQPSLIRVEADEATYNLHIILRFELEQELFTSKLAPSDLPAAWNARMHDYLNVDVPDNARGVLQDIHWSSGQFGYFPTYSLGNIISCQIWEKAQAALPGLYDQFEQGQFQPLREWLRDNLHRYGRKFTPKETLQKVVGGPINVGPYIQYLTDKVQDIYGV